MRTRFGRKVRNLDFLFADGMLALWPMQLTLLKSKIHRAAVTGASLDYEGSLTISSDLAERVGLLPYERILVGNMGNGERFETYVIYGEAGAGQIQLNGATAHLGKVGDRITIMNFGWFTPEEAVGHEPRVIVLNEKNEVVRPASVERALEAL
jgi:aspartate 1-decarboxylase